MREYKHPFGIDIDQQVHDAGGGGTTSCSFRDPAGFLFWRGGEVFRCVRPVYETQFREATSRGLYAASIAQGLMLPFTTGYAPPDDEPCVAVLKPRQLTQITYPYEWSFEQLKDAAALTLKLHMLALERGMVLKDASAYNVQMVDGAPCFIDHLSFDLLSEHGMWPAYGQFCRHFLAPLALMSRVDLNLNKLLELYIDGVPLDLAAKLLPISTRLSLGLYMHLHLHARLVSKHGGARKKVAGRQISAEQLAAIAKSLLALVSGLEPKAARTEWGDYYSDTNYSDRSFAAKKRWIREMVAKVRPRRMWDVGANDGTFSHLVKDLAGEIVSMDIDPVAVGRNYRACRSDGITNVTPLVIDVCNPSPATGFANRERASLADRGRPDLVIALALIHHLAISNNLPFADIAGYFASLADHLVIEFVRKSDSQVERLLLNRPDIFDGYTEDGFKSAFGARFTIVEERPIPGAERTLYLMTNRALPAARGLG